LQRTKNKKASIVDYHHDFLSRVIGAVKNLRKEETMQKIKVDVKSKGTVLGSVEVPKFESLAEAVKASSEQAVLDAYNKVVSDKITNTYRSEQTRESSPMAKLSRAAKKDPKLAAKIEKLLAEAMAAGE
jgi:hypothetical protein